VWQVISYDQLEEPAQAELLNDLYTQEWGSSATFSARR